MKREITIQMQMQDPTVKKAPKVQKAVFGKRAAVSRHRPPLYSHSFPGAKRALAKLSGKPIRPKKRSSK